MDPYQTLSSEKKQLEAILAEIPVDDVIERTSFEARLERIDASLSALTPSAPMKKASLTFRGAPVIGSRAIAADFTAKVTSLFNDAVAAIAAGLQENLKYMGKIPHKKDNRLFITGTAIGSFGFEFEVPTSDTEDDLFPESSPAAEALDRLLKVFEITASGDDEALAEVVDEIHPRAVKKIAEMLDYTAKEQAWCGLSFSGHSFRFRDHKQLEAAAARVREDNIRESTDVVEGVFLGVLPRSRNFEFKSLDGNKEIRGRISAEIDTPEKLNDRLNTAVKVKFNVVQVGQGRPKYTLLNFDAIMPSISNREELPKEDSDGH
jgi:hypothetical protein